MANVIIAATDALALVGYLVAIPCIFVTAPDGSVGVVFNHQLAIIL